MHSRGVLMGVLLPRTLALLPIFSSVKAGFLPQAAGFQTIRPLPELRGGGTRNFGVSSVAMASAPTAVSCSWLASNLDKVKVLDASWYMATQERSPGVKLDAAAEFAARRIPGALFFDFDGTIKDAASDLPHMMPSPELFSQCVGKLGISNSHHVIVYDGLGVWSSPRGWYMFKAMGHHQVSILDGGFPAWEKLGLPIETEPKTVDTVAEKAAEYVAAPLPKSNLLDLPAVEANIKSRQYQLVDARPGPRFLGEAPEPRPIESGHIQGSLSVPWSAVVKDGFLKTPDEIREVMEKASVDLTKPVAITCGSGVSACIVGAALELVGVPAEKAPLFDGAYTEWKLAGKPSIKGKVDPPASKL
mmetsp:Transcript_27141/g.64094  ORF Transcript_27141/g.64094 Transcript_27141/m.64094 type:complete len:360 (+) Transcript_27141:69-1148(+)